MFNQRLTRKRASYSGMIIQRGIFRELCINLLIVTFSISILLFMERFVRLTGIIMWRGTDIKDIIRVFIYLQPSILTLSIPMALLISIFLTYGRMLSDNEIVILKNSGMSFLGISKAPLLLSLSCFIIMLSLSLYLSPKGMQSFKKTLYETIVRKALMVIEKESFSRVFKDTVIYINEMPAKGVFKGVFVYREDTGSKGLTRPVVITASDGEIISNPNEGLIKLILHNGMIHTVTRDGASEVSFSQYDFILSTGIEPRKRIKPTEIETIRLWQGRRDDPEWDVEFNRRFAIPFASIIFGILGPPIAMRMGSIGRLGGLSFSLVILLLYYAILIATEGLAKAERLTVFMGEWIPNMVFLIIALIAFLNSYSDRPVKRL
ncbi:MAG: LPS export ABC transporter permease LptF [Thermodesulfovibrionia bacterium]